MEAPEKALPAYDELPMYKNFPGCAWAVWGADDQLGTVNLLTKDVVQRAVAEEVRYVCLAFVRSWFVGIWTYFTWGIWSRSRLDWIRAAANFMCFAGQGKQCL